MASSSTSLPERTPAAVNPLWSALRALASLRLTVTLFAFSILLIFVGTLAQVHQDMWSVIDNYFRTFIARVELQVFVPESFFPQAPPVPGWIYIPGGWTLGSLLAVNLLAAHTLRFKIQAQGTRLAMGALIIAVGLAMMLALVWVAARSDGSQSNSVLSWSIIWQILRWGCAALWGASVIWILRTPFTGRLSFWTATTCSLLLGAVSLYVVVRGDQMLLSEPSLRILWQLIQAGSVGLVLLAGCNLVFAKRGAIVVIHAGVALLMLYELSVSLYSREEQFDVREGQTVAYAREPRFVEIAIVDKTHAEYDEVVTVPLRLLKDKARFTHPDVPFDLQLVEHFRNSILRDVDAEEPNAATAGVGRVQIAEAIRPSSGASGGELNAASAYVRIFPKSADTASDTYLLTQHYGDATLFYARPYDLPEKVVMDGTQYELSLRFRRNRKPYTVHLTDIRKDDYLGTETPRDYSSYVVIEDAENGRKFDHRIWMNNPLRYAGQTFYQNTYRSLPDGTEATTLAVVTNNSWLVPYVACMIVGIGMLAQFLATLSRFVKRQLAANAEAAPRLKSSWSSVWIPGTVVTVVFVGFVWYAARPNPLVIDGMQLDAFGQIPIVFEGRSKPIDSLARNTLKVLSDRQSFVDSISGEKTPAIKWLLDAIILSEAADRHRVFRIESMDVQDVLGLPRRKRFRYAVEEFRDQLDRFDELAEEAGRVRQRDPGELTGTQRKILETRQRLASYVRVQNAFRPIPYPPLPTAEERQEDPDAATERLREIASFALATPRLNATLMRSQPPLAVPVAAEQGTRWVAYAVAMNEAFIDQTLHQQRPDPHTLTWNQLLDAYDRGDAETFNRTVAEYLEAIDADMPGDVAMDKIRFEAFFNRFQPFTLAAALYLVALVLTATGWLGWFEPLRRASLWLIVLTWGLHTFALVARIYISDRPPITNLYSTAPFIGWGCVLLCIVLELIYGLSICNAIAAVAGVAALVLAHNLSFSGDTITVMRAILDTQFWLSTHVVCITLGYATTLLAGLTGTAYIVGSVCTPFAKGALRRELARMTYGVLCFAMFFSFLGTVLGGLWADDSWGRFWGWDPKENGALIIVLWNAIILHARWGGMIKDRGIAVLAVLGNIATTWSWFGVNELGVGLHSYGFTEGVLQALAIYMGTQLIIAAVGLMPLRFWWSRRAEGELARV